MTCQNLWNAVKAALRGKYVAMQAYLKGKKKSDNLDLHLKEPEKEQNSKLLKRKKIKDQTRNKRNRD